MAYNKTEKSDRPDAPMKRRPIRRRKKVCVFLSLIHISEPTRPY